MPSALEAESASLKSLDAYSVVAFSRAVFQEYARLRKDAVRYSLPAPPVQVACELVLSAPPGSDAGERQPPSVNAFFAATVAFAQVPVVGALARFLGAVPGRELSSETLGVYVDALDELMAAEGSGGARCVAMGTVCSAVLWPAASVREDNRTTVGAAIVRERGRAAGQLAPLYSKHAVERVLRKVFSPQVAPRTAADAVIQSLCHSAPAVLTEAQDVTNKNSDKFLFVDGESMLLHLCDTYSAAERGTFMAGAYLMKVCNSPLMSSVEALVRARFQLPGVDSSRLATCMFLEQDSYAALWTALRDTPELALDDHSARLVLAALQLLSRLQQYDTERAGLLSPHLIATSLAELVSHNSYLLEDVADPVAALAALQLGAVQLAGPSAAQAFRASFVDVTAWQERLVSDRGMSAVASVRDLLPGDSSIKADYVLLVCYLLHQASTGHSAFDVVAAISSLTKDPSSVEIYRGVHSFLGCALAPQRQHAHGVAALHSLRDEILTVEPALFNALSLQVGTNALRDEQRRVGLYLVYVHERELALAVLDSTLQGPPGTAPAAAASFVDRLLQQLRERVAAQEQRRAARRKHGRTGQRNSSASGEPEWAAILASVMSGMTVAAPPLRASASEYTDPASEPSASLRHAYQRMLDALAQQAARERAEALQLVAQRRQDAIHAARLLHVRMEEVRMMEQREAAELRNNTAAALAHAAEQEEALRKARKSKIQADKQASQDRRARQAQEKVKASATARQPAAPDLALKLFEAALEDQSRGVTAERILELRREERHLLEAATATAAATAPKAAAAKVDTRGYDIRRQYPQATEPLVPFNPYGPSDFDAPYVGGLGGVPAHVAAFMPRDPTSLNFDQQKEYQYQMQVAAAAAGARRASLTNAQRRRSILAANAEQQPRRQSAVAVEPGLSLAHIGRRASALALGPVADADVHRLVPLPAEQPAFASETVANLPVARSATPTPNSVEPQSPIVRLPSRAQERVAIDAPVSIQQPEPSNVKPIPAATTPPDRAPTSVLSEPLPPVPAPALPSSTPAQKATLPVAGPPPSSATARPAVAADKAEGTLHEKAAAAPSVPVALPSRRLPDPAPVPIVPQIVPREVPASVTLAPSRVATSPPAVDAEPVSFPPLREPTPPVEVVAAPAAPPQQSPIYRPVTPAPAVVDSPVTVPELVPPAMAAPAARLPEEEAAPVASVPPEQMPVAEAPHINNPMEQQAGVSNSSAAELETPLPAASAAPELPPHPPVDEAVTLAPVLPEARPEPESEPEPAVLVAAPMPAPAPTSAPVSAPAPVPAPAPVAIAATHPPTSVNTQHTPAVGSTHSTRAPSPAPLPTALAKEQSEEVMVTAHDDLVGTPLPSQVPSPLLSAVAPALHTEAETEAMPPPLMPTCQPEEPPENLVPEITSAPVVSPLPEPDFVPVALTIESAPTPASAAAAVPLVTEEVHGEAADTPAVPVEAPAAAVVVSTAPAAPSAKHRTSHRKPKTRSQEQEEMDEPEQQPEVVQPPEVEEEIHDTGSADASSSSSRVGTPQVDVTKAASGLSERQRLAAQQSYRAGKRRYEAVGDMPSPNTADNRDDIEIDEDVRARLAAQRKQHEEMARREEAASPAVAVTKPEEPVVAEAMPTAASDAGAGSQEGVGSAQAHEATTTVLIAQPAIPVAKEKFVADFSGLASESPIGVALPPPFSVSAAEVPSVLPPARRTPQIVLPDSTSVLHPHDVDVPEEHSQTPEQTAATDQPSVTRAPTPTVAEAAEPPPRSRKPSVAAVITPADADVDADGAAHSNLPSGNQVIEPEGDFTSAPARDPKFGSSEWASLEAIAAEEKKRGAERERFVPQGGFDVHSAANETSQKELAEAAERERRRAADAALGGPLASGPPKVLALPLPSAPAAKPPPGQPRSAATLAQSARVGSTAADALPVASAPAPVPVLGDGDGRTETPLSTPATPVDGAALLSAAFRASVPANDGSAPFAFEAEARMIEEQEEALAAVRQPKSNRSARTGSSSSSKRGHGNQFVEFGLRDLASGASHDHEPSKYPLSRQHQSPEEEDDDPDVAAAAALARQLREQQAAAEAAEAEAKALAAAEAKKASKKRARGMKSNLATAAVPVSKPSGKYLPPTMHETAHDTASSSVMDMGIALREEDELRRQQIRAQLEEEKRSREGVRAVPEAVTVSLLTRMSSMKAPSPTRPGESWQFWWSSDDASDAESYSSASASEVAEPTEQPKLAEPRPRQGRRASVSKAPSPARVVPAPLVKLPSKSWYKPRHEKDLLPPEIVDSNDAAAVTSPRKLRKQASAENVEVPVQPTVSSMSEAEVLDACRGWPRMWLRYRLPWDNFFESQELRVLGSKQPSSDEDDEDALPESTSKVEQTASVLPTFQQDIDNMPQEQDAPESLMTAFPSLLDDSAPEIGSGLESVLRDVHTTLRHEVKDSQLRAERLALHSVLLLNRGAVSPLQYEIAHVEHVEIPVQLSDGSAGAAWRFFHLMVPQQQMQHTLAMEVHVATDNLAVVAGAPHLSAELFASTSSLPTRKDHQWHARPSLHTKAVRLVIPCEAHGQLQYQQYFVGVRVYVTGAVEPSPGVSISGSVKVTVGSREWVLRTADPHFDQSTLSARLTTVEEHTKRFISLLPSKSVEQTELESKQDSVRSPSVKQRPAAASTAAAPNAQPLDVLLDGVLLAADGNRHSLTAPHDALEKYFVQLLSSRLPGMPAVPALSSTAHLESHQTHQLAERLLENAPSALSPHFLQSALHGASVQALHNVPIKRPAILQQLDKRAATASIAGSLPSLAQSSTPRALPSSANSGVQLPSLLSSPTLGRSPSGVRPPPSLLSPSQSLDGDDLVLLGRSSSVRPFISSLAQSRSPREVMTKSSPELSRIEKKMRRALKHVAEQSHLRPDS